MQLVLDKVSTSYDQSQSWALRKICLTINQGEFLGIAGPTGSGKSTLLQHLNGLLSPTTGTITAGGKSLADKKERRPLRGRVGLVFQYPERQLFAGSVLEDVAFGPRNMGCSAQETNQRACYALEQVGLDPDDIKDKSPFALSGGEQRRVAIAGVLAMQPKVLALDEPAAGLDPAARASVLAMLEDLNRAGMTIIMTSHDMDDLARLCTRIAVLNEGSIVCQGTPEEVFSDANALDQIGLALPFAQEFANRLKSRGLRLPRTFYSSIETLAADIRAL